MQKLEQLSRREFLEWGLRTSAGVAGAVLMPSKLVAQENQRNIFERSSLYNMNSLPEIRLEELKEYSNVLTSEQRRVISKAISDSPLLRGKEGKFKGSYITMVVKFEPDERYANRLAGEGKKSIEDIFKFLGSAYLQKPEIDFIVPRRKGDIKFLGYKNIPLYLVADFGNLVTIEYEFDIHRQKIPVPFQYQEEKSTAEWSLPIKIDVVDTKEGRQATFQTHRKTPIFYNTSADIVNKVEAPSIEALHKSVMLYTLKHYFESIKTRTIGSSSDLVDIYSEFVYKEEKFVHALSILWLNDYNKRRKILTKQELEGRFSDYERHERYISTNQLARHISKIGLQKSIELYINNPNELFRGAGLK